MNKDTMKGNWEQFKGKAKQQWAKLGDNDLALLAEGKAQEFSGKIQEAYGRSKDEADKEIKEFERNCGCSFSDKAA
ncbi:MAG: CsbD family protein [Alphaproteobacteria bacterium]|nr:CsbD family protein [Alphaproteobacteria bacterium]